MSKIRNPKSEIGLCVHPAASERSLVWATGHGCNLIQRVLLGKEIVGFHCLVACNGGKLIQKLRNADTNAHKVVKCFNTNTSTCEYWRAALDLWVYHDGVGNVHPATCVSVCEVNAGLGQTLIGLKIKKWYRSGTCFHRVFMGITNNSRR